MKIIIFGNSASGKSTLAKLISSSYDIAHLDLDTIAWVEGEPGVRLDAKKSYDLLDAFLAQNSRWVIEGCYSSLISYAAVSASKLIFLNSDIGTCQKNAKLRPWEPHKYPSKEKQDSNLEMLLTWIAGYDTRDDEFSRVAHQKLYDEFLLEKHVLRTNSDIKNFKARLQLRR